MRFLLSLVGDAIGAVAIFAMLWLLLLMAHAVEDPANENSIMGYSEQGDGGGCDGNL
jgi:hypothetical protein